MKKKSIGLVVGDVFSSSLLHSFEFLTDIFNVHVYVITSEGVLNKIPKSFKPLMFKENPKITGYIKGIENKLSENDVLVCMNFGSLLALQVAKVADEKSIPLITYVPDVDLSVYESYDNLKNIQNLLIQFSIKFIVPFGRTSKQLEQIGVDKEKIIIYTPKIDANKFNLSNRVVAPFRKNLKFTKKDIVIMYKGEFENFANPKILLKSIKLLSYNNNQILKKIKIIYVGEGSLDLELKYLSWNLGLGGQTFFLNQNTDLFWPDLLAACDLVVFPKIKNDEQSSFFPFELLEVMTAGCVPLVPKSSLHSDLVGEDLSFNENDYESLTRLIDTLLGCHKTVKFYQDLIFDRIDLLGTINEGALEKFFYEIYEEHLEGEDNVQWEILDANSQTQNYAELTIKELNSLLKSRFNKKKLSMLFCFRGQAYGTLKNFEKAEEDLQKAMILDPDNGQARCSHGYLMWYCYNHEDAMISFKKGLSISPENTKCLLGIALVYKRMGMIEDAIFWFEKSIMRGAKGVMPITALVQACSESKSIDFSIASMKRVIEYVGENEILMRGIAQQYLKAGNYDVGSKILRKYLQN